MTATHNARHVELAEGGQLLAAAEVESLADPGVVRASLHAESGHLPSGTRSRLVDAVLDSPEAMRSGRLEATVPLGDAESLDRLRARCDDVETRPAGGSCLVDAVLPPRSGEAEGDRP
jgi:hypothetical protein